MAEATQSQQLSPAAPGDVEIVQNSPSALLAGLVSAMVGYRQKLPSHVRQVEAASLTVPLVISFGDPFAIGLGRTPGDNDRYGSFAAGLFAGPVVVDSFGTASCLQINFTPLGARRFFGMPMSEIADRMVGLDDVLGQDGMALREQLANQPDWNRRFDLAEAFVVRKLASTNAPSREIEWAFDHILNRCGRVKIASIARSIGWSRKHLGQRFAQDIGLGPKTVARIVRFNHALTLSRAGENGGWAGIAAECGYSDQAHLVREFGELAGASPGAWSANGGWAADG